MRSMSASLRHLPDLELAALVCVLHEMTLAASALELQPQLFGSAVAGAIREVLARREGRELTDQSLFAKRPIPLSALREVRSLAAHGADKLRSFGFDLAAAVLDERASSEILVDTATLSPRSGVELRTLN